MGGEDRKTRGEKKGATPPKGKKKLDFHNPSPAFYKPLIKKNIYLDLKNYRGIKNVEADLKILGANVTTFFSKDIHYLITSQGNPKDYKDESDANGGEASSTVSTPSPFNIENSRGVNSPQNESSGVTDTRKKALVLRGKAILDKARIQSSRDLTDTAKSFGVKIVHINNALLWMKKELEKIPKELKDLSKPSTVKGKLPDKGIKSKKLKNPFIKFEATNKHYRPIYRQLDSWPKLDTSTPLGSCPFDGVQGGARQERAEREEREERHCSEKESAGDSKVRRDSSKPRAKTDSADFLDMGHIMTAGEVKRMKEAKRKAEQKQGFCELCNQKYDDIDKHVRVDQHQKFARDGKNYKELDDLIDKNVPSLQVFVADIVLSHERGKSADKQSSPTPDEVNRSQSSKKLAKSPSSRTSSISRSKKKYDASTEVGPTKGECSRSIGVYNGSNSSLLEKSPKKSSNLSSGPGLVVVEAEVHPVLENETKTLSGGVKVTSAINTQKSSQSIVDNFVEKAESLVKESSMLWESFNMSEDGEIVASDHSNVVTEVNNNEVSTDAGVNNVSLAPIATGVKPANSPRKDLTETNNSHVLFSLDGVSEAADVEVEKSPKLREGKEKLCSQNKSVVLVSPRRSSRTCVSRSPAIDNKQPGVVWNQETVEKEVLETANISKVVPSEISLVEHGSPKCTLGKIENYVPKMKTLDTEKGHKKETKEVSGTVAEVENRDYCQTIDPLVDVISPPRRSTRHVPGTPTRRILLETPPQKKVFTSNPTEADGMVEVSSPKKQHAHPVLRERNFTHPLNFDCSSPVSSNLNPFRAQCSPASSTWSNATSLDSANLLSPVQKSIPRWSRKHFKGENESVDGNVMLSPRSNSKYTTPGKVMGPSGDAKSQKYLLTSSGRIVMDRHREDYGSLPVEYTKEYNAFIKKIGKDHVCTEQVRSKPPRGKLVFKCTSSLVGEESVLPGSPEVIKTDVSKSSPVRAPKESAELEKGGPASAYGEPKSESVTSGGGEESSKSKSSAKKPKNSKLTIQSHKETRATRSRSLSMSEKMTLSRDVRRAVEDVTAADEQECLSSPKPEKHQQSPRSHKVEAESNSMTNGIIVKTVDIYSEIVPQSLVVEKCGKSLRTRKLELETGTTEKDMVVKVKTDSAESNNLGILPLTSVIEQRRKSQRSRNVMVETADTTDTVLDDETIIAASSKAEGSSLSSVVERCGKSLRSCKIEVEMLNTAPGMVSDNETIITSSSELEGLPQSPIVEKRRKLLRSRNIEVETADTANHGVLDDETVIASSSELYVSPQPPVAEKRRKSLRSRSIEVETADTANHGISDDETIIASSSELYVSPQSPIVEKHRKSLRSRNIEVETADTANRGVSDDDTIIASGSELYVSPQTPVVEKRRKSFRSCNIEVGTADTANHSVSDDDTIIAWSSELYVSPQTPVVEKRRKSFRSRNIEVETAGTADDSISDDETIIAMSSELEGFPRSPIVERGKKSLRSRKLVMETDITVNEIIDADRIVLTPNDESESMGPFSEEKCQKSLRSRKRVAETVDTVNDMVMNGGIAGSNEQENVPQFPVGEKRRMSFRSRKHVEIYECDSKEADLGNMNSSLTVQQEKSSKISNRNRGRRDRTSTPNGKIEVIESELDPARSPRKLRSRSDQTNRSIPVENISNSVDISFESIQETLVSPVKATAESSKSAGFVKIIGQNKNTARAPKSKCFDPIESRGVETSTASQTVESATCSAVGSQSVGFELSFQDDLSMVPIRITRKFFMDISNGSFKKSTSPNRSQDVGICGSDVSKNSSMDTMSSQRNSKASVHDSGTKGQDSKVVVASDNEIRSSKKMKITRSQSVAVGENTEFSQEVVVTNDRETKPRRAWKKRADLQNSQVNDQELPDTNESCKIDFLGDIHVDSASEASSNWDENCDTYFSRICRTPQKKVTKDPDFDMAKSDKNVGSEKKNLPKSHSVDNSDRKSPEKDSAVVVSSPSKPLKIAVAKSNKYCLPKSSQNSSRRKLEKDHYVPYDHVRGSPRNLRHHNSKDVKTLSESPMNRFRKCEDESVSDFLTSSHSSVNSSQNGLSTRKRKWKGKHECRRSARRKRIPLDRRPFGFSDVSESGESTSAILNSKSDAEDGVDVKVDSCPEENVKEQIGESKMGRKPGFVDDGDSQFVSQQEHALGDFSQSGKKRRRSRKENRKRSQSFKVNDNNPQVSHEEDNIEEVVPHNQEAKRVSLRDGRRRTGSSVKDRECNAVSHEESNTEGGQGREQRRKIRKERKRSRSFGITDGVRELTVNLASKSKSMSDKADDSEDSQNVHEMKVTRKKSRKSRSHGGKIVDNDRNSPGSSSMDSAVLCPEVKSAQNVENFTVDAARSRKRPHSGKDSDVNTADVDFVSPRHASINKALKTLNSISSGAQNIKSSESSLPEPKARLRKRQPSREDKVSNIVPEDDSSVMEPKVMLRQCHSSRRDKVSNILPEDDEDEFMSQRGVRLHHALQSLKVAVDGMTESHSNALDVVTPEDDGTASQNLKPSRIEKVHTTGQTSPVSDGVVNGAVPGRQGVTSNDCRYDPVENEITDSKNGASTKQGGKGDRNSVEIQDTHQKILQVGTRLHDSGKSTSSVTSPPVGSKLRRKRMRTFSGEAVSKKSLQSTEDNHDFVVSSLESQKVEGSFCGSPFTEVLSRDEIDGKNAMDKCHEPSPGKRSHSLPTHSRADHLSVAEQNSTVLRKFPAAAGSAKGMNIPGSDLMHKMSVNLSENTGHACKLKGSPRPLKKKLFKNLSNRPKSFRHQFGVELLYTTHVSKAPRKSACGCSDHHVENNCSNKAHFSKSFGSSSKTVLKNAKITFKKGAISFGVRKSPRKVLPCPVTFGIRDSPKRAAAVAACAAIASPQKTIYGSIKKKLMASPSSKSGHSAMRKNSPKFPKKHFSPGMVDRLCRGTLSTSAKVRNKLHNSPKKRIISTKLKKRSVPLGTPTKVALRARNETISYVDDSSDEDPYSLF